MAYNAGTAKGAITIDLNKSLQSLKDLREGLKNLGSQSDVFGDKIKKAGDNTDNTTNSFNKSKKSAKEMAESFKKAGDKIKSVGDTIKGVGTKLTLGVTTPLVALATASINTAMEFEQSMANVKAVSGATGDSFSDLVTEAKRLGASTEYSAKQVADAMGYMGMAGWDATQMLDGIAPVLDLATATQMDLATASDIVTDGLTAMGYTAKDTALFCDVLAKASSASNTNVEQMGEAFSYVAPIAGQFNMSIEDVGVALGLMANSGIKASQAGTSLRQMLTNLGEGVEFTGKSFGKYQVDVLNADDTMRGLGDIIADMREAFTQMTEAERMANAEMLTGKTGMAGLATILGATEEDYQKLTSSIYNSSGASESMAGIMRDTSKNGIEILKSSVDGLMQSIGELMLPMFNEAVSKMSEFFTKLNGMSEETKKSAIAFAGITAILPPVILIVGNLISSIGSIVGVLAPVITTIAGMLNPVTLVVGAFALLGAEATRMAMTTDNQMQGLRKVIEDISRTFKEQFEYITSKVRDFVNNCRPQIDAMIDSFRGIIRVLEPVFVAVGVILKGAIKGVMGFVSGVSNALEPLTKVITNIVNIVKDTINLVIGIITGDGEKISLSVQNLFTSVVSLINNSVEAILSFIQGWFESMGTTVQEAFTNMLKWLNDFFGNLVPNMVTWGRNIIDGLVNGITNGMSRAVEAIKNVGTNISNKFKEVMGIHSPSKIFEQMGKYIDEGLEKGIVDNQGLATRAMDNIARAIIGSGNTIKDGLITVNADTGQLIYDKTYTNVNRNIDLYMKERDERIRMMTSGTDETIRMIDKEINATQKAYDIKLKLMEQEYQAKIGLIDNSSNEEIKALQDQLDAMDAEKEQERRNEEDASLKADIEEKKKALEEYSGDYDGYIKAQEALAKAQSNLEKTLLNRQREDEKKALREQMQEIRDKAQADKDAIRESYEEKKWQLEQQKADEIEYLKEMQGLLNEDFKQRKELEEVHTKLKSAEEDKRSKKEIAELRKRETELKGSLKTNEKELTAFSKTTGDIAEATGELFLQGFKSTEYELTRYLEKLEDRARDIQREAQRAISDMQDMESMAGQVLGDVGVGRSIQGNIGTYLLDDARDINSYERRSNNETNTSNSMTSLLKDTFNYDKLASIINNIKPNITLNSEVIAPTPMTEREVAREQELMLRDLAFNM